MALLLASFVARIDATILAQLTDDEATTVDNVKVQLALDDAWNEIQGYVYDISADMLPPDSVLESHQVDLALYKIASARPGEEFESLAARYKASIRYLENLRDKAQLRKEDPGLVAQGTDYVPIIDDASLVAFGDMGLPD